MLSKPTGGFYEGCTVLGIPCCGLELGADAVQMKHRLPGLRCPAATAPG